MSLRNIRDREILAKIRAQGTDAVISRVDLEWLMESVQSRLPRPCARGKKCIVCPFRMQNPCKKCPDCGALQTCHDRREKAKAAAKRRILQPTDCMCCGSVATQPVYFTCKCLYCHDCANDHVQKYSRECPVHSGGLLPETF